MVEATGWGATDIGRKRENNQDSILFDNELGIYAVADGMGGHAAGEVASKLALETFSAHIRSSSEALAAATCADDAVDSLRGLVRDAVLAACAAVHSEASSDDPSTRGMGTTLTALVHAKGCAVIAHVGDSRAYLLRGGRAHQITSDHTFAADLARLGIIEPSDVANHPHAHVLTRALGPQAAVDVELLVLPLQPDDRFLLSSDGLSEYIPDAGWLEKMLARERPDLAIDEMIAFANEAGGKDNISLVCVDIRAADEPTGVEGVQAQLSALRAVPLFEELGLADATRLLNRSHTEDFRAGDVVFEAGEARRGLIVVLSGAFSLVQLDGTTSHRTLSAGEYIGASTLVKQRAARHSLRCDEPGRALFLWADGVTTLAQNRPWLGIELYRRLASRLAGELAGSLTVSSEGGDASAASPEWF